MAKTIIAITGGIASGKSTAATALRELGADVIDADAISRQLTAKGGEALPKIRQAFGEQVFTKTGELDRKALGARVFADPSERERLNAILHPMIRLAMEKAIAANHAPVVVLDVPLLFETGMQDMAQAVWLCYCPEETQIQRVMERDGLTREQAMGRIASQWPTQRKLRLSSEAIDTSGDIPSTKRQIEALWERLSK